VVLQISASQDRDFRIRGGRGTPAAGVQGRFSAFGQEQQGRATGRKPERDGHLRTTDRWNGRQRDNRRASPCILWRGESSDGPFADRLLSCFSAIGPKAINLPDTPAAGVFKPWAACESCRTPAHTSRGAEQRGLCPPRRRARGWRARHLCLLLCAQALQNLSGQRFLDFGVARNGFNDSRSGVDPERV
jgi:hypothetical protein